MGITILTVGKITKEHLDEMFLEYIKRTERFTKTSVVQIKDYGQLKDDRNRIIRLESEEILKSIAKDSFVILLDKEGKSFTTESFAKLLEKKDLMFIIGGVFGAGENVKSRANLILSFSKMTFPHKLARVILSEQIYRGFTIKNNMRYHK